MQKCVFFGHFTGATEKYFFSKKLKTNVHRKKYRHWLIKSALTSYMVKLIFFCPIYIQGCPVLMLGFCAVWGRPHKLMSKKTMTTFVGCFSFDKKQYSISKGQLLPIAHTFKI